MALPNASMLQVAGAWVGSRVWEDGFGNWKQGGLRHTTCGVKCRCGHTANSAFSGVSGFKGFKRQRLVAFVRFGEGCEGVRGRRCIRLKTQGWRSGIGTKGGAHPHIPAAIVADSAAHPGTATEGTHLLPPERGFSRQRWELRCRCRLKPALEFGHSGAVNPEGCRR